MNEVLKTIYFLVQQMWFFAIPLLIVALGGMFSERSGVVNIALEGIMIVGAFCSIFFINFMQGLPPQIALWTEQLAERLATGQVGQGTANFLQTLYNILLTFTKGQPLLILAIFVAVISGMVFSLLHAYAGINLRSDQTISGTALNMIAPAFAIYMARTLQTNNVQQVQFTNTFRITSVPVLGDIPVLGPLLFQNTYITTYLGIVILLVAAFVLYKTKFGLRLRSCGEHPQAADSVGINVYRIRYAGVMISGALAGLGGLVFVIPTSTNFNATVAGYGFLALAVLIFGQWKPLRIFMAALFFGLMKTIASAYSGVPFLKGLPIPSDIYKMVPYITTLIVLAFTSRNSQAPKASGVPYDRGGR